MAYDTGFGILSRQFLEQSEHRSLLGFSPGVIGTTFLIETTLVANTERATVVVAGMNATDILRENRDNGTVATDVVVIGGLAETGLASRDQVFDTERAIAAGRTAVNNKNLNSLWLYFFHRQLCMRKVETKAVMTVRIKLAILLIVSRFIKLIF